MTAGKEIDIFLPMNPPTATQQEKRFNAKTKTMYTDDRAKEAREKLRAHLVQHIPDQPFTGPISMNVIWGYLCSKSHPNGYWNTNKPDLDNAQKALQDVMTELGFWIDDKQIANLTTSKIWTFHPGISIIVSELPLSAYEAAS